MDELGLESVVLFPGRSNIGLDMERAQHRVLTDFAWANPGKAYPICQVNPHIGEEAYRAEVGEYLKNGYYGMAIDPLAQAWDPLSHWGDMVFRVADDCKVPLFVGTGVGLPLGQPIHLTRLLERYPHVRVVLMHAGRFIYSSQYRVLGSEYPNVYFETSEGIGSAREIKYYVTTFGPHRVMMGSGTLDEIEENIYMYQHAGLGKEELQWCTQNSLLAVLDTK
jgi:predicted TIM-barrel fold metal-dependent hydrolase